MSDFSLLIIRLWMGLIAYADAQPPHSTSDLADVLATKFINNIIIFPNRARKTTSTTTTTTTRTTLNDSLHKIVGSVG